MKHIWNLLAKVGSLWVALVHVVLLKGKYFWNVKGAFGRVVKQFIFSF